MRVAFYRDDEARVCGWNAVRGKRTRIPGTVMALGRGGISHDLAQYVVEASTGYQVGFWGLLSRGATFKSTGRKRTQPGRALIATHRPELGQSEQIAAIHLGAWLSGGETEVTAALTAASKQFSALRPDEELLFDWPSARGTIRRRGSLA
jgi:hypothetical protein